MAIHLPNTTVTRVLGENLAGPVDLIQKPKGGAMMKSREQSFNHCGLRRETIKGV